VSVLDHEQHRTVRPDAGEKVAERVSRSAAGSTPSDGAASTKGPESTRCAEGVAAPEDGEHASVDTAGEVLDESGLADPGLTADEDDTAVSDGGVGEGPVQVGELRLTLEQLPHGRGCNTIAVQSGSSCSGAGAESGHDRETDRRPP
jgi:hypothetical protein